MELQHLTEGVFNPHMHTGRRGNLIFILKPLAFSLLAIQYTNIPRDCNIIELLQQKNAPSESCLHITLKEEAREDWPLYMNLSCSHKFGITLRISKLHFVVIIYRKCSPI